MCRFILSFLIAAGLIAGGAVGREKVQAKGTDGGGAAAEVQRFFPVRLAQELAAYGRRQRSPEALAVAAQILIGNPTRPLEAEVQGSGEPVEPKKGGVPPAQDPAALLAEAKQMAAGNSTMLAMISQMEGRLGERPKGTRSGTQAAIRTVNAYSKETFWVRFNGGELAWVGVTGDGDTDLDLYVYDSEGRQVASDTDVTDVCEVSWRPGQTGRYRIVVENLGGISNVYWIGCN